MSPEVTIAVVSWNTRDLLRRCLSSLEPEQRSGRADVWVIDNASHDGSPEMVRAEFPWVELIESEENLGFGRAVNEIARRTSAPWIAPANADIELTPGALGAMIGAGSDPRVASVAPRLITSDGSIQHSVHAFPSVGLALFFALGAYRLPEVGNRLAVEGYWRSDRPRLIDWAHGAFLLVRREAWDQVGGFDERQWMYAEDIDIHWRLRHAGWSACYEPRARVLHAVSAAAVQAFGATRVRRHIAATYAWQARTQGLTVTYLCAICNALGSSLRWLGAELLAHRGQDRDAERDRFALYVRAHLNGLRISRAPDQDVAPPARDHESNPQSSKSRPT